jgi:sensor c-di-GMP phosphodiesterase-like protein
MSVTDRMIMGCRSLEMTMRERYPSLNIRCVGGVYNIRDDDYSITTIVDRANMARHKAGEFFSSEAHIFEVYDGETENRLLEEKKLEGLMASALEEGQFKVFFQPKVDVKNEKIGGAEALVRWIAPDGQFIPNYKFIPLFERNGFILRLDKYVYEETF